MLGSTPTDRPSKVEPGPSERLQYSHNYPPPNNPPGVNHLHVPAYGTPPQVAHYPPPPLNPPPAPSTAHVYRPSEPSPYGLDPGVASTTRLRTSIACRYCRKRKIRCSGKDSALGSKCQNCSGMNQECIFSDIKPASAFDPDIACGFVLPRDGVNGSLGEPSIQTQDQNRDIGSSGYGSYPSLSEYYYPQYYHPPPRDDYGYGPRPYYDQGQDDEDSLKAYPTWAKHLQELTSSLSDNQTSVFLDLDNEAFDYTVSVVPINSVSTVGGHDVSETRKSHNATSPERSVQTLQDHRQQAALAIPSFPPPQGLKRRPLAALPEILQDQDRESLKLGEVSGTGLGTKLTTRVEASKESIELPDPAKLSIRSPTTSSSPTVSSNIDVDSISGDSEGQFDGNSLEYCLFSRVFCRLAILSQGETTVRGKSNSSGSKGKQVAKSGSASSSTTRDTASTTGEWKNRRQGDDNGDESKDRQNEPPKKRGKTSQSHCDERSQFLACPYWKADSRKYWDCFLKKNDTIAHLKQHLTRRHTPKYYCQICYQTFRDFDLFDSHALERSCTRGPSAKLEGISQKQKNQLSLKSKGSVEQQWYTVWSILFPDMEPPATIYIYSTQSEDFCRIQEFAQREGVAIMLDELESNGLVVRPDASNQLLRSTVQRAMVSIFRSYSVRREPSSEAEEPIVIQDLQPDNEASFQQEPTTGSQIGHGNLPTTSADVNWIVDEGMDDAGIERLSRPSISTWSQLPTATSWLPRGVVQDNTEDESWGPAFPDEPAFGESSSGNDLPFNFESSDMLDLDALLRDVISTEA
ncbi:uncharacterized protein FPRO_06884 [Fusarium proliferatum ET1]|uniref:Zn(2)-C6 fungal-type domain-containing protein n=1 Tax=Fusarium proliferatum (strain ET1) TaxID=1227346 RepID=A0A1L7VEP3_FUSPR|nr:uncharacterized protein FPRO_06884 [Fusarium proliferatum ET1]CZR37925.1 uncharacterized protein FPRO_06884 [Fusarium proliferatum ET1]